MVRDGLAPPAARRVLPLPFETVSAAVARAAEPLPYTPDEVVIGLEKAKMSEVLLVIVPEVPPSVRVIVRTPLPIVLLVVKKLVVVAAVPVALTKVKFWSVDEAVASK